MQSNSAVHIAPRVRLLCLAAVCVATPSWAVTVRVAGRVAHSKPSPVDVNGHLLLPAPFISERLGIAVETTDQKGTWQLSSYGRWAKVYAGSVGFKVGSARFDAQVATEVREGVVFVPAEIIERAFDVAFAHTSPTEWDLRPQGAAVSEIRQGNHAQYLRLVVDVTGPAAYWVSVGAGQVMVELPPPDPITTGWGCLRLFSFDDPVCPQAKVTPGPEDWSRIIISHGSSGRAVVRSLGDPTRLVIDVPRDPVPKEPTVVATVPMDRATTPRALPPAVSSGWDVRNFSTQRGAVRVFTLEASPTAVRPALASSTIRQRAPVSRIAGRAGADAAVNGGHFDWSGPPLGMLVIDGEWIKAPMYSRCVLGVSETGEALMDRLNFRGVVRIEGLGSVTLDALNTGHAGAHTAVLYTRRWGTEVCAGEGLVRVVVSRDATIARVETDGDPVAIPSDGYVLSGKGKWAALLAQAREGAAATVSLGTQPQWPTLRYALGAGPRLVKAGKVCVTATEERFRSDVLRVTSRSAVGLLPDGNVLVVAMEARAARGVNLDEAACIMLKLGCREAMALDGGGSTTVVDRGRVINHPLDGGERPVSNALLIFGRSS